MKRKYLISLIFVFTFFSVSEIFSQRQTEGKVFNLGATIGFNTDLPVINSLYVDDVKLENVSVKYKVGHLASVFFRLNMDRLFLQPNFSWRKSEAEIHFTIPQNDISGKLVQELNAPNAKLAMKVHSLQVPVLVGYHIVRQGRYGLSILAGPNFKYNYDVSYTSESTDSAHEFLSENTPLGIGITTGVAVKIWQLFFDFSYEFGLNQTESDFKSKDPEIPVISNNIRIDKRTNVMSFSLGFVF